MKTTGSITRAALAALTMASSAAFAQSSFYAGAAIGQSRSDETCDQVPISCDDNDSAWRIFGGYQFNRYFGAELGYADLGTPASASGTISGVPVVVRTEITAWDLVAVGLYPIDRFSIYGKLGLYRADTESTGTIAGLPRTVSDTNTDLTFGLGAGFDITKNLRLRAEWQRYKNVGGGDVGEDHLDLMSLGLVWLF